MTGLYKVFSLAYGMKNYEIRYTGNMKQLFIRRSDRERLMLFFGGWGTDERLLDFPLPENGMDIMLCCDYRSLDFDASLVTRYRSISLLAWSMGVWVADHVLGGMPLPLERKVAFNGTQFPMDDARGIPVNVFKGTLDGFSETVLAKFRRRMCASSESLHRFMEHASRRCAGELREELQSLYDSVTQSVVHNRLGWDKAVVGQCDRIFPPGNQLAAWHDMAEVQVVDAAHYDAAWIRQLITETDPWTRN